MNGKHARMVLGARNSQILSHITELAQSLRRHPRDVVLPFFQRISQPEYRAGFDDAVQGFVDRIMKRAVEKRKEMDAERRAGGGDDDEQELSREERLGPGGLDPVEVFETLPRAMQEAFESKDVARLQDALMGLPNEEAKYHMKRCEDSGLWVAGGGGVAALDDDGAGGAGDDPDAPPAPPAAGADAAPPAPPVEEEID